MNATKCGNMSWLNSYDALRRESREHHLNCTQSLLLGLDFLSQRKEHLDIFVVDKAQILLGVVLQQMAST